MNFNLLPVWFFVGGDGWENLVCGLDFEGLVKTGKVVDLVTDGLGKSLWGSEMALEVALEGEVLKEQCLKLEFVVEPPGG